MVTGISSEGLSSLSHSGESDSISTYMIPFPHSISTFMIPFPQIMHISSKILLDDMELGPSSPQEPSTIAIIASDESRRSSSITSWEFLIKISLGELDAYPEH